MRTIPNYIVQTLLRTLPLILANMDEDKRLEKVCG